MRIRYRYFYEGTKENKGRMIGTIATQENTDGTISVGFAKVHPKEAPSRVKGRLIAQGRLQAFQAGRAMPMLHACSMSSETLIELIQSHTLFKE